VVRRRPHQAGQPAYARLWPARRIQPWRLGPPRLAAAGLPDDGPIWLQTTPRLFGYAFNPVSFWYCHDRAGALRALVAEVNNTFGDHHAYLVTAPDLGPIHAHRACHAQALHVSPFNTVQGHYAFHMRETEERPTSASIITTTTACCCAPRSAGARGADLRRMLAVLAAQPWAIAVIVRIHWQAVRLWWRSVPFHGKHPPSAPPVELTHFPRHFLLI
jgi:DUF1365 family protein